MKNKTQNAADMNPTKNDLGQGTRSKIVEILQQRVADGADLFYAVRTAHFNVKGPSFGALHALFETIYTYVDGAVDEMAERAVQLGGQMHTTLRQMATRSQLDDYPTDLRDGQGHCEAVSDRLAHFAKLLRDNVDEAEELEDKGTSDMLLDITRQIDKFVWMVEAHTQTEE